jgi:diguanylate cyclase (GGDEF)-like protein/PAS domain S-box-containing protein
MDDVKGRLLVVDDIEENRDLLKRQLMRRGYDVAVANSGQSALAAVARGNFDLVLLHIMMPGMTELETLERLRRISDRKSLPVIMISAKKESEEIEQALDMGANDFIVRPIDYPMAFARIETHLALKHADDALRNSEERFALAMEGSTEGIWEWDLTSDNVFFSDRWKALIGHEKTDLPNQISEWFDRIHEKDINQVRTEINKHLDGISLQIDITYRMRHANMTYRWVRTVGMAQRDANGSPTRLAGSLSDVTEDILMDPHTDIPNRTHFRDCIDRAIAHKDRNRTFEFGVIVFELDAYKDLKSSVGHSVTEQLLSDFAQRLKAHTRPGDSVALIGENAFAMLVDDIGMVADTVRIAERAREIVEIPFDIFGQEITSTLSAGIATSYTAYESGEDILRDAALGLRSAQELGGDCCQIVDPDLHAQALARLHLEADLRRATIAEDFALHYQPIIDLSAKKIVGFETLLRWDRPDHGLVSPTIFIPIAERTALINPIGKWVLTQACHQFAEWQRSISGDFDCVLSVNVSPRQIEQDDFVSQFAEVLAETGLDPNWLKIEITESAVLSDMDNAVRTLEKLHNLGIRIAVDDFGTGYSSLSTLLRVPIDTIKIDRSFTCTIDHDPTAQRIVKAIINMAYSLGKDIVAEGIETKSQASIIREMGAQYGQGFLYSEPVPADQAFNLLKVQIDGENPPSMSVAV